MSLSRGTRIEICPTRLGRDFVAYAAFDGSQGVVEALTGSGGDLKARVDVASEAKDRAGRKFLPARALKVIPG